MSTATNKRSKRTQHQYALLNWLIGLAELGGCGLTPAQKDVLTQAEARLRQIELQSETDGLLRQLARKKILLRQSHIRLLALHTRTPRKGTA